MTREMMKPELFVSVDIEADGEIPGKFSMTALGATFVDIPNTRFYVEFMPISEHINPVAAAVAGLDRDTLIREGQFPGVAMRNFAEWLMRYCNYSHKPVFVGVNAPFDWMFVCWYFHTFIGHNPFGSSALDVKSYAMAHLGIEEWWKTAQTQLPGQFFVKNDNPHNALEDAIVQAEVFRRLRESVRRERDLMKALSMSQIYSL